VSSSNDDDNNNSRRRQATRTPRASVGRVRSWLQRSKLHLLPVGIERFDHRRIAANTQRIFVTLLLDDWKPSGGTS
jgi:hypothetical protein